MSHSPTRTEQPRDIVEDRVRDRSEGEPSVALDRSAVYERCEAVVLPAKVVLTVSAVRDAQAPLARNSYQATIAKERAEDHLELHGVRRDPAKRDARIGRHALLIGRA